MQRHQRAERLAAAEVDAFLVGLNLLGSGGGGDPSIFRHALRAALRDRPLPLRDPAELGESAVAPVGMIGGTRMLAEKLPSGHEFARALDAVTRWTGQRPTALMPFEGAALNGALAVLAALQLQLPLVDADLMGRALPRLDQLTRTAAGGTITPMALAEPGGRVMVMDSADAASAERLARAFVTQSGGWAGAVLAPAPASRTDCCRGGLARALRLGRAHQTLPDRPDPARVAATLGGRLVGGGRVADITRQSSAGFGRATITITDRSGEWPGVLRLEAENEYLLAVYDGAPVAGTPDLICVLTRRTATPIPVDGLRLGDDLLVLVLPGPPWWRENHERLRHVDPGAFGLGHDPVPPALPDPARGERAAR